MPSLHPMAQIQSKSRKTLIRGLRASTLKGFKEALLDLARDAEIVLSDLSLGSCGPHHAAVQLAEQLGISLPRVEGMDTRASTQFGSSAADLIARWIDEETQGDRICLKSMAFCSAVIREMRTRPSICCIVLPRFGFVWSRADQLFVELLSAASEELGQQCVLLNVDTEPCELPEDWKVSWSVSNYLDSLSQDSIASLVPSVVMNDYLLADPELWRGHAWQFRAGSWFVAPELRKAPYKRTPADFEQLAELSTQDWLRSYALCHGATSSQKYWFLLREGYQHILDGGEDSGFRLLRAASRGAENAVHKASIVALTQGLLIATLRFDEAAQQEEPSDDLPAQLRGILHQHKGWALLMRGEVSSAMKHLQCAVDILLPRLSGTREALYLLNIYALAWLRNGLPETALRLEMLIAHFLQESHPEDSHLRYINCLNTARLYRHMGDHASSRRLYEEAFATAFGVRSENDAIYFNACLARLAGEHGDKEESFAGWLRTTLHWLSARTPEALPARTVSMLLGVIPQTSRVVEQVSSVLLRKLEHSARTLNISCAGLNNESPQFVNHATFAEQTCHPNSYSATGSVGWGVMTSDVVLRSSFTYSAMRELRNLAYRLLSQCSQSPSLRAAGTIIVDDQFGTEIPTTIDELLNLAVRWRAETVHFGNSEFALNDTSMLALEWEAGVSISKAVKRIARGSDESVVQFKRVRPPRKLNHLECQISELIGESATIKSISEHLGRSTSRESLIRVIRVLERDRVLTIHVDDAQNHLSIQHV